ncbi:hypothetical protein ACFELO_12265 [Oceanicaulis sp. LC35]|uniref:hypothetical protein n=1 Tax=Oceanicaulis sp. LC35 TaxID=3349635 RepID=UPI003F85C729
MRWILAGLCALGVSACATGAPDRAPLIEQARSTPDRADSLPPQELADGQCGIFLFGMGEGHPFVVFENERAGRALILHDGVIHELGATPQPGAFVLGESFRRVYLDQTASLVFTLTGEVGEATGSGPRLENVLLRARAMDGSETVRPLGGVYSCRTGAQTAPGRF